MAQGQFAEGRGVGRRCLRHVDLDQRVGKQLGEVVVQCAGQRMAIAAGMAPMARGWRVPCWQRARAVTLRCFRLRCPAHDVPAPKVHGQAPA
ncbi:hypothetical protein D3C72_1865660 [compost metagenome]